MSFMPNQSRATGMNSAVRNLLFWTLMILLAVVLWQMLSHKGQGPKASQLSYSDFMKQVDAKNLESAKFTLSQNTADVSGYLKNPMLGFETTVPANTATDLMNRLRADDVDVQVAQGTTSGNFIMGALPVVFLVGVWIYIMRQRTKGQSNANPDPSTGALG
jgi:cell division protease FtsH